MENTATNLVSSSESEDNKGFAVIDQMISCLGVDMEMQSDPDLIKDIVEHDMYLDGCESALKFLDPIMKESVSFAPLLEHIRSSIVNLHPAVVEFCAEAMDSDLVSKIDQKLLTRLIHHTYILEELTREMGDSREFMVEIKKYYLERRLQKGIRASLLGGFIDLYRMSGSIFHPIKTKTMDWVFGKYEMLRFRDDVPLTKDEIGQRQKGIVVNIVEAVVTDKVYKFSDNSTTGIALAINPFRTVKILSGNKFIEYGLSQDWASLYETWNLAFVTANVDNLHITYPKLFIPKVIDAPKNHYLFNRALALFLTLQFRFFYQMEKRPAVNLTKARELGSLWGAINLKYAKAYVKKVNNMSLKGFWCLLRIPFRRKLSRIPVAELKEP
tara:strand:- start:543 stop:1694 length:1152 start_codon:yes stop_codon:yes gene_type:complete